MKCKVNLSADMVIVGYEWVADDESEVAQTSQGNAVFFDHQPDLEAGKYRWDGEKFVLARPNVPFTPDGPDAWYAVYRLMRWMNRIAKDNTNLPPIPPSCRVWMEYYRKSFTSDAQE